MMSLWDALRMNMMISYQELVRTFPTSRGIAHLGAAAIIGDEVSVYPQQYKPGNDIFYDGLIFHDGNYQYEE